MTYSTEIDGLIFHGEDFVFMTGPGAKIEKVYAHQGHVKLWITNDTMTGNPVTRTVRAVQGSRVDDKIPDDVVIGSLPDFGTKEWISYEVKEDEEDVG